MRNNLLDNGFIVKLMEDNFLSISELTSNGQIGFNVTSSGISFHDILNIKIIENINFYWGRMDSKEILCLILDIIRESQLQELVYRLY